MSKKAIIRIISADNIKEKILEIESNLRKLREDVIRLEQEPLQVIIDEVEDIETSNPNN